MSRFHDEGLLNELTQLVLLNRLLPERVASP